MGVQQWVQRYNGPGNYFDGASSLAVDGSGNVYVTGSSDGIGTGRDYATLKYNSSGNILWNRRYNGLANAFDAAGSIVIDGNGSVYISGSSTGLGTSLDYVTIKYNSNGDSLWVKTYNGVANQRDVASSLALDVSGNVYVLGQSIGNESGDDFALIKYNSDGDQLWIRLYNGPANSDDQPFSIAIDDSGNIYVTGLSNGIGTGEDYVTIKYSPSGDSLWVKRYNGPGNSVDQAYSVGLDDSGNVYVTGQSLGIGTDLDYATIKYNSSGVQQWIQRYNGPSNSGDGASSLGIDDSNNIYVSGTSYKLGSSDYATLKYNSLGIRQWVQRYDGIMGDDMMSSMKVDSTGNVYVTGSSWGYGTHIDFATIKYSKQPTSSLNLISILQGLFNNITMIKDTVRVYIRNTNSPFSIVDSSTSILDLNGMGTFSFTYTLNNGVFYYIVVKHRNSIETWSQKIIFSDNQFSYVFTSAANKAYGKNLVLKGSKYCIYSGDVNQDMVIDLKDVYLIYNDVLNAATGYVNTDLTGDNFVDLSDLTLAFNNSTGFVKVMRP